MTTLREKYHEVGNKLNTALMGVGIAKRYIETLEPTAGNEEIIKESIHSCALAEKALLELDESISRLKSLSYRFADPDAAVTLQAARSGRENAAISILIVDDEPEICELVKQLYEKRGFAVSLALGGVAAIAQIKATRPDIVLLDLHLNDRVDGVDVLRYIRKEHPGMRCVVITREDDAARIKDVTDLGPDDILIKPVMASQLDAKVNSLVAGLGK
ncbi:MAG: response regulator [Candidatus Omnitrophica bacterium]|nr:response regulator [Candidatus Omnitrophota bacterium]